MKLDITYQIVTKQSAKQGDFEDQGFYEQDIEFDSIEELAEYIKDNCNGLEPSSSVFHKGIYYSSTDAEVDYNDGSETYYSYHVNNLTELQEKELYSLLMA